MNGAYKGEKISIYENDTCIDVMNQHDGKDIRILVGSNYNYEIRIEKEFGPTIGEDVRIRMESYDWIIERRNHVTDAWELKVRWDIQESIPNCCCDGSFCGKSMPDIAECAGTINRDK